MAKRKSGSVLKKEENWDREKKWKPSKKRPKVVPRDAIGFARHLKTQKVFFIYPQLMPNTVGLNMCVTLKKMPAQAEHIFDTFEYFWVDHKSKFFCNCLVTRWRHHRFCWKLEFWAEIFFWWILLGKKWLLGSFGSIFCPKMGLKGPKTLTHLVAKSTVKQSSFWAF